MRTRTLLVPAMALALVLGACGGDDDPADDPDTSLIPPESTEATTTASTTETTTSGSTAPSAPTSYTGEARDAVNELKAAWEAGDQARARAIATGDVVDALFAVPPGGFEVQGCDTGEFETSGCTYRNRASGAFISVTAIRSEAGWQIQSIDVNAD